MTASSVSSTAVTRAVRASKTRDVAADRNIAEMEARSITTSSAQKPLSYGGIAIHGAAHSRCPARRATARRMGTGTANCPPVQRRPRSHSARSRVWCTSRALKRDRGYQGLGFAGRTSRPWGEGHTIRSGAVPRAHPCLVALLARRAVGVRITQTRKVARSLCELRAEQVDEYPCGARSTGDTPTRMRPLRTQALVARAMPAARSKWDDNTPQHLTEASMVRGYVVTTGAGGDTPVHSAILLVTRLARTARRHATRRAVRRNSPMTDPHSPSE